MQTVEEAMPPQKAKMYYRSVQPFVSALFRATEEEERKTAPKWVDQRIKATAEFEKRLEVEDQNVSQSSSLPKIS